MNTSEEWIKFDPWLGPIARIAVAAAFGREPNVTVHALIDTGATTTLFASAVLQHIGAKKTGKTLESYSISHEPAILPEYVLALSLPFTNNIKRAINIGEFTTFAADLPFGTPRRPYYAIIGQDLLAHCRVVFDGPAKCFQLVESTGSETEGRAFTRGECPVHDVTFSLPDDDVVRLKAESKPIPPLLTVSALIDTGSSHSDVSENVIAKLGAVPIDGKAVVHHAASRETVELAQFSLAMSLTYTTGRGSIRSRKSVFTVAPVSAGSCDVLYDALLGWNILQNCRLVFDGRSGRFQINRAVR
jgi:hypothetical protein